MDERTKKINKIKKEAEIFFKKEIEAQCLNFRPVVMLKK